MDIVDISRLDIRNKYSKLKMKKLSELNVIYLTDKEFTCF